MPQINSDERKQMLAERRKEQRSRVSDFMWPWTKNSDPAYRKN